MASWISYLLSYFWPSDVSVSDRLLGSLPLRPSTRYFTLALRDPQQPKSVLYILSTLLLSEQSALDVRDLIDTVKPRAVVGYVGIDAMEVIRKEHAHNLSLKAMDMYPKSVLHVLKESFHDGNNRAKYMRMAQTDVMRAIFGTTIQGNVAAAKKAAEDSNSSFYYLESPEPPSENAEESKPREDSPGAARHVASPFGNCMFSPLGSRDSRVNLNVAGLKFTLSQMQASLQDILAAKDSSAQFPTNGRSTDTSEEEYECPEFAQVLYPFLAELHGVFKHLPGLDRALEGTQKLLMDVDKGNVVDQSELAVCRCFRLAAEGLRVALNESAKASLRLEKVSSSILPFDELSYEEKCYVLLAQALKQQLQKSQSVVAILDPSLVAGIRKYWTTSVPDDVTAMAMQCLIPEADEDASLEMEESKGRILDKPIIVVGAGAAAAVGVASLSQWAPASTAMKILSFKVPAFVKLLMLQTKKGAVAAVVKTANPVVNWFLPSGKGVLATNSVIGSKVSVMKAAASTGNIRTVAHSVIATAKRASLSAIRTAFYNAMRNRHRKGVGGRLWLSFGASVGACAGLLQYGEGIENVMEIVPQAFSISQLCQGVSHVCLASEALKQVEDAEYWGAMYQRLYEHPN